MVFQGFLCDIVQSVEGDVGVGAAEGDALALGDEDGVVKVSLGGCEGA